MKKSSGDPFLGPFFALASFLLLLSYPRGALAIKLRDFGIPAFAVEGEAAVLVCDYDLEGLDLYSLKWYKGGLEFYRYIPGNRNPYTIYKRAGVSVDRAHSDDRQVTLTDLTMDSTGRYRCEVSTEGPSFTTASNYGDMAIVVLPSSGPTMQGGKRRYKPGDRVDVNCTSRDSKPAADLTWYINRRPADESLLVRYPIMNNTYSGLHTSVVGLVFNVTREHFGHDGDMKLKCTASIDTVYTRSNEKSAQGLKRKRHSGERGEEHNTAHGMSSLFGSSGAATPAGLSAWVSAAAASFLAAMIT